MKTRWIIGVVLASAACGSSIVWPGDAGMQTFAAGTTTAASFFDGGPPGDAGPAVTDAGTAGVTDSGSVGVVDAGSQ